VHASAVFTATSHFGELRQWGMGEAHVRRQGDIAYGCGQSLDIYEPGHPGGSAALLLWHGRGPNERDVLEPLAERIAAAGVATIVPDWSRDDGGGGKHDLGASLAFIRELSARNGFGRVVLAGWSLGANAGLDVVLRMTFLGGWRPAAFIGISGGFDESPYREPNSSGVVVDPSLPLLLIHGSHDEIVPVERARITFESLRRAGWDVTLREIGTDHAGGIGTVYDPAAQRCVPTEDPDRRQLLTTVAGWISEFALTA
jgi:acetyl esterase/lipase